MLGNVLIEALELEGHTVRVVQPGVLVAAGLTSHWDIDSADGQTVVIYALEASSAELDLFAGRVAVAFRGASGCLPLAIVLVTRNGETRAVTPLEHLAEQAIGELRRVCSTAQR